MTNSTNLIYYEGGCYGTFVEWSCYYFSNIIQDTPFIKDGSSHEYVGNFLEPSEKVFEFISSKSTEKFARCHTGLFRNKQLSYFYNNTHYNICFDDLLFVNNSFKNILVLHPTSSTFLWMQNNMFQKCTFDDNTFETWFEPYGYDKNYYAVNLKNNIEDKIKVFINREMSREKFLRWGKESIEDFEIWEFRELLSQYWFNRFKDSLTCWDDLAKDFKQIKFMSLNSFKEDPLNTIISYLNYFNIPTPPLDKLNNIIDQWKSKQIHMYKDDIVIKIVNSIINKENFDWSNQNLTILDESYIQKVLMDRGIRLKCFGLNKFPTNTADFLSILE
jgi:hypothetical protein